MSKKHNSVVQKQFSKTADAFSTFATRDTNDILSDRVEFAKAQPGELALDVACGPGTLVLELATRLRFARGIDLTREMLLRALALQAERQIRNACFEQGEAERLPYSDGAFDLVTCQFAFHHMLKPAAALKEMVRVLKPEGRLLIADTLGPESDEKWELHNRIERVRDPSHVASLRLTSFLGLFEKMGLYPARQTSKPRPRSFNRWMLRAGIDPSHARYQETRALIEDAIPGDRAAFGTQREGEDLIIFHHEGMFLLRKTQSAIASHQ
jgi:ubiquinone/menaquinone biosynthesis C-methylase UbiE